MPTPLPPASNETSNAAGDDGNADKRVWRIIYHCYFADDGPKSAYWLSDSGTRAITELDVEGLGPVF